LSRACKGTLSYAAVQWGRSACRDQTFISHDAFVFRFITNELAAVTVSLRNLWIKMGTEGDFTRNGHSAEAGRS
jgi:hypothetical protein